MLYAAAILPATPSGACGFIGERFGAGAGLQYLNARYYDPKLGMFLQPDWFEVTAAGVGTNRYAYAGGDPVNASDSGGNEFWDWFRSQEKSDRANTELAELHSSAALNYRNRIAAEGDPDGILNRNADLAESNANWYQMRVGVSANLRMRLDLGLTVTNAAGLALLTEGVRIPLGGPVTTNVVPSRLARVVESEYAATRTLGPPGASSVFVTAADDIAGITNSTELAQRLTLLGPNGNLVIGPRAVIEFDTPTSGIASPVFQLNPGFVGFGQTAGGAREFLLPNLTIDSLGNVTIRIVQ